MEATGIILAGGSSKRMGKDKAFLPLEGKPLIEVIIDKLSGFFGEIIIAANLCDNYAKYKQRVKLVKDIFPGCGPLGGVQAGLLSSSNQRNFLLACDAPFFNTALAEYLADKLGNYQAAVPEYQGRPQPLFAFYNKNCLGEIGAALAEGNFKMRDLLLRLRVKTVNEAEVKRFDPGGASFININTENDYKDACRKN